MKIVTTNRKAKHDYKILEVYDAGIVLNGNEVKSLRINGASIDESFCRVEEGEVLVYSMHIPEFIKASYFRPDPRRPRKLLLHKNEIKKLFGATTQKGSTIIPLKVYFNDKGLAKIEIGIARGVHRYDKRRKIKEEIVKRESAQALKQARRNYLK